jgi:hypothetical protein
MSKDEMFQLFAGAFLIAALLVIALRRPPGQIQLKEAALFAAVVWPGLCGLIFAVWLGSSH